MRLLRISQVAERLGFDQQTVRNKLAREKADGLRPGSLVPPSVVLPGSRSRRWAEDDVDDWLGRLLGREPKRKKVGKGKGQRVRERQVGMR